MTDDLRSDLSALALAVIENLEATGGRWTLHRGDAGATREPPTPAAALRIGTTTWIGHGRTLDEAVFDALGKFRAGSGGSGDTPVSEITRKRMERDRMADVSDSDVLPLLRGARLGFTGRPLGSRPYKAERLLDLLMEHRAGEDRDALRERLEAWIAGRGGKIQWRSPLESQSIGGGRREARDRGPRFAIYWLPDTLEPPPSDER